MPTEIILNDGRVIKAPGEMKPEELDAFADIAEAGRPLPRGFTIQPAEVMQGMQEQQAPTPFQQVKQAVAGPAAAVRDVATEGVGRAVNSVMSGLPGDIGMATEPASPMAQQVAQGIVPQTPGQLVSRVVLTALGVPQGMTRAGGALARAILPTMAGQLMEQVVGDGADQNQALKEVIPAIISEGAWAVVPRINRLNFTQAGRDKIGNVYAQVIGGEVAKVSSVKNLMDADGFRSAMAGKGKVNPKVHETNFQADISATMDHSQEQIEKALPLIITQLPSVTRQSAMQRLEDVAGKAPTMVAPKGAPPSLAVPINRVVGQDPPETLLKQGLQRLREQRQKADSLEGAESYAAWQEYGKMRQEMESTLESIHPSLKQQYDAMNVQYARDIDIRDFLWRMKDEKVWTSDSSGTHFNIAKASDVIQDADRLLDETGLFGGSNKAMMFIAGPSGVPGARPVIHDGYTRVFSQMPFSPLSMSMAGQPQLLVNPMGQVTSGRARALSDFMGQTGAEALVPMEGGQ
jgi:hypothetical protein